MPRVARLTAIVVLMWAAPAHATLYEIGGRTDGAIPSTKHPRAATDVDLEAQLLTALPDGSLAAVTGWIDSLVGIDANGIAAPLKGARHLVEDPADIAAAPGGGVLVSNEEVVQRVAPDGARSTVVAHACDNLICQAPWGLAPRPDGALLVAYTFGNRVDLVRPDGSASTLISAPLHWPFALGNLPDGGLMVAEGKPGHGRVSASLRVWRFGADGAATVVAGGGRASAPVACGGGAAAPVDLDLREIVDATTSPSGDIYVADRRAGLFVVAPDGSMRVLACPPSKLAQRVGDLRPEGLELGQVRLRVRHLAVAPDGTLYVVDGAGRVFADLAAGAARLGLALQGRTLSLSRAAQVSIDGGRPVALPAGVSEVALPRARGGLSRLRIVARSGAAVATVQRRRVGHLGQSLGRRLLRRELRRASRFAAVPRLRGCRADATAIRCTRPDASLRVRSDDVLAVRRGRRRWLAAP